MQTRVWIVLVTLTTAVFQAEKSLIEIRKVLNGTYDGEGLGGRHRSGERLGNERPASFSGGRRQRLTSALNENSTSDWRRAALAAYLTPGVVGVPIPNEGFNRLERSLARAGNATQQGLRGAERAIIDTFRLQEDARTASLTARDMAIAQRLAPQEAAVQRTQKVVNRATSAINESVNQLDQIISRSVARPITRTTSTIAQTKARVREAPSQMFLALACYAHPECCLTPELCDEV